MRTWGIGAQSPIHKFSTNQLRFNGLTGELYRNERVPDGNDGFTDRHTELQIGTVLGIDVPSFHAGYLKFAKGVAETVKYMRPASHPMPIYPIEDGYKEGVKFLCATRGLGLMVCANNGAMVQDVIREIYDTFMFSPEARLGKIPLYRFDGCQDTQTKKGIFPKPIFVLVGWMNRNPATWGPVFNELPDLQDQLPPPATSTQEQLPPPARPAAIDQVHQERLAQSSQASPKPSRDPRYNVIKHAAEASPVATPASTMSEAPKPGFSTLLDDEIPW